MKPVYTVCVENEKLWHLTQLYDFLIKHQNQSIVLELNPEAPCLDNIGLYDILDQFTFKQVEIITANPLEKHDKYKITIQKVFYFFNKFNVPVNSLLHTWNKKKVFLCLYGRPNANRLGILSYMHQHYKDLSLLGCQAHVQDEDERARFELDKLFKYRAESIAEFADIGNQFPLTIADSKQYQRINEMPIEDILLPLYQDILIDLVAETFVQGTTFFPTEKTGRPIMLKKPMIIMASQNYLDYLHQMGFKTFCDFWDENYDGYEGKERFLRILKLIDTLAQKSVAELEQMYQDMQPILEHNFLLLQSKKYNTNIKEIL